MKTSLKIYCYTSENGNDLQIMRIDKKWQYSEFYNGELLRKYEDFKSKKEALEVAIGYGHGKREFNFSHSINI